MEKLAEIKEQINQLAKKMKQNQRFVDKSIKADLELGQVMQERNELIDKLTVAEQKIEQLIQKIKLM